MIPAAAKATDIIIAFLPPNANASMVARRANLVRFLSIAAKKVLGDKVYLIEKLNPTDTLTFKNADEIYEYGPLFLQLAP